MGSVKMSERRNILLYTVSLPSAVFQYVASRGSWDIYEYLKLAPPDLVKDLATHDTLYNKTIRRFLRKVLVQFNNYIIIIIIMITKLI